MAKRVTITIEKLLALLKISRDEYVVIDRELKLRTAVIEHLEYLINTPSEKFSRDDELNVEPTIQAYSFKG